MDRWSGAYDGLRHYFSRVVRWLCLKVVALCLLLLSSPAVAATTPKPKALYRDGPTGRLTQPGVTGCRRKPVRLRPQHAAHTAPGGPWPVRQRPAVSCPTVIACPR